MKAPRIVTLVLWLLAILCLAALLLITGAPAAGGILALIVLLPFASLLWNRAARRGMSVRISLPSGVRKRARAEGTVRAGYGRLIPLGKVLCELEIKNDLTGEETRLTLPMEKRRDGMEAAFALETAHCGRMRTSVRRITLLDFFGFLAAQAQSDAVGRMTVLPDTFPVEIDPALLSAPREGEDTRDDRKGTDMTETFQLRDYQPGDNLHGIHWKLSSKLDKLIFREPAQPVSNALLLYWDQAGGTPAQLDTLAEAVFSVGQALSELGVPYTLGRSEQGLMHRIEVTCQDDLAEGLPTLLRRNAPQRPALSDLSIFGRVFYFTTSLPGSERDGSVQIFLCGDEKGAAGDEIVFTPENAAEVLERLDAYHGA